MRFVVLRVRDATLSNGKVGILEHLVKLEEDKARDETKVRVRVRARMKVNVKVK